MKKKKYTHNQNNGQKTNKANNTKAPSSSTISDFEIVTNKRDEKSNATNTNQYFSKKLFNIYLILWIYFFIKLFFTDPEVWFVEVIDLSPYLPFLRLRVFLLPLVIIIVGKWKGYNFVLKHIIHFLTVPFYFTIWKILYSFYQKFLKKIGENDRVNSTLWVFIFEFLGRIVSNFSYYLIQLTLVAFSSICLLYSTNFYLQILAFSVSIILFLRVFIRGILQIISPVKIFGFFKVDDIVENPNKSWVDNGNNKEKTQLDVAKEALTSYMILFVLQRSVKDILEKKGFILFFLANFILTYFIANSYLAISSLALFNLDNTEFNSTNSDFSLFDFYFYNFYGILGEGTNIEPIKMLSKCLKMSGTIYGLFLLVFVASVLLDVFSEKYSKALESILDYLMKHSKKLEPRLSNLLGLPLNIIKSIKDFDALFAHLENKFKKDA